MFEKTDQIVNLIGKHFRGELTPKEGATFEVWLSEHEENGQFLTLLTDANAMEAEMWVYANSGSPDMWKKVQQKLRGG